VRTWKPRPYYGQFFGGVVLGSILTAAAIGVAPPAPNPGLCWYWSDPYGYRGYWDYCAPSLPTNPASQASLQGRRFRPAPSLSRVSSGA
jgi:hypothetical protein